jgi:UDP-glucose 4-epimerase
MRRSAGRTLAEPTSGDPHHPEFTYVVTGAAGFLGRALTAKLAATGARVIEIDLASGIPSPAREVVEVDLLDAEALRAALTTKLAEEAGSVVVFHLAARGHVGSSRDDPRGAVTANVIGTLNVLEACRDIGVARVVFPSTALVYRVPAAAPLGEDARVASTSVYAATKLACEALLEAYAAEYGLSCTVARLGNVYGPGAAADTVVSIIVRQAMAGGPVVVNTFAPVRDFIYRDDVIAGLMALARRPDASGFQRFNLSSGVPTSIGELAVVACEIAGVRAKPTQRADDSTADADKVVLSIERLTTATGWAPAFSLAAGLRATMAAGRPTS